VPFRLTICGLDEVARHCAGDVTDVLSILDPDGLPPDGLASYEAHRRLELRFHDVIEPRPEVILPGREDVARLLAFGRDVARRPEPHLLVHCHAGVSRSTAAACLILAQARPEQAADEAFAAVAALRPQAWPNLRLIELGDVLLGRGGDLVAAARTHYRRALDREPSLAVMMTALGRSREVAAARTA